MPDRIPPNLHPLIRDRWSPVGFSDRVVASKDLALCLEAARWAPSSYNDQPWRFVICDRHANPEAWQRLLDCLAPGNLPWVQRAPLLILATTRANFRASDQSNPHAWHDLGLATENLVLQAQTLGIYSHMIAGFDRGKARESFAVPGSFEPVSVLVMGYRCDPGDMTEDECAREAKTRERRSLSEIAFAGMWNESYAAPEQGENTE